MSTTTAISLGLFLGTNLGLIIGSVLTGILTLVAGLLGLGWSVRKFKQKITGGSGWTNYEDRDIPGWKDRPQHLTRKGWVDND